MKNPPLIDHIVVAITATTLFLFQIAMLMKSMSSYLGRGSCYWRAEDIHTDHKQE
jgi:hypothetical protein